MTDRDQPGGAVPPPPGLGPLLLAAAAGVIVVAVMLIGRPRAPEQPGGVSGAAWPDMRIDVNRAGADELTLLPGIGEAMALRILDDRDERGAFASVDDLERVRGIGAVTVERLRPYLVAGEADGPEAAGRP